MTLAGSGWRYYVGILSLCILLSTMCITLHIIYTRHNISPLNIRSKITMYITSCSAILMCLLPCIEVWGESFIYCPVYFWLFVISYGIICGMYIIVQYIYSSQ